MTPTQAIHILRARLNGVWDDPELEKLGPLGTLRQDVERILSMVDQEDELVNIRSAVRLHDDDLNRREIAPTGDDYNAVVREVLG
ncbi:hypothetical protein [Mesorhizobium sp. WSM2239]|uniref:Uncharacterized protein n=2 Tax=unclassified Mesorhizobium TaxID=325217 RepID=A0AAU8DE58_9HYPH